MSAACRFGALLLAIAALASDPVRADPRRDPVRDATGLAHAEWTGNLQLLPHPDPVTVTRSIVIPIALPPGPGEITVRPSHCHAAFGNDRGTFYTCALRTLLQRNAIAADGGYSSFRMRPALWRSADGQRAAVLFFWMAPFAADDSLLMHELPIHNAAVYPLPAEAWSHIQPGHGDVSAAQAMDSASRAALQGPGRSARFVQVYAAGPAGPDEAVVMGDLRAQGITLIQAPDDADTALPVQVDADSVAGLFAPGRHRISLYFVQSHPWTYEPEMELPADLLAGHTYLASVGMDDKPYLEDLGAGVRCERRALEGKFDAAGNGWEGDPLQDGWTHCYRVP
jgi:hypothetical protein